jgi:hypothetical protein
LGHARGELEVTIWEFDSDDDYGLGLQLSTVGQRWSRRQRDATWIDAMEIIIFIAVVVLLLLPEIFHSLDGIGGGGTGRTPAPVALSYLIN